MLPQFPCMIVTITKLVHLNVVILFFIDTATTEIYTLSLHDALPISSTRRSGSAVPLAWPRAPTRRARPVLARSEEHTSELQSLTNLVCRLLLEKKKR